MVSPGGRISAFVFVCRVSEDSSAGGSKVCVTRGDSTTAPTVVGVGDGGSASGFRGSA